MMSARERLCSLSARKRATVVIPELSDATVLLQSPSAGEWLDYQRWLQTLLPDSLDHLTRLVSLTAIDEDGEPLFTEEDCRNLPHYVLTALSRAAFDLTSTTDKKVEASKGES